MNIALIIGVSEYELKVNNLPGCKKDAQIVNEIINKTGKFDSVLYLNDNKPSAVIKEKLTDFISENKANEIDELFFYFTGHGEFVNDEFYYILSDYKEIKRKQTTLQNDEVDSLIKTLNPKLVIKMIDACQSGKTYIKESAAVDKYFKKTQNNFNNCYFLNSSLKDQSSLQTDQISDFTLSFINSVREHQSNEIRYKDIIDFISDEFITNDHQTPFFVIQADYTEKFCEINKGLKEYLDNIDFTKIVLDLEKSKLSLIEKIKSESAEFLTKEQALDQIIKLKTEIETYTLTKEFEKIFDLNIYFLENYDSIVKKNTIGKWLDETSHNYFAKSTQKRVKKVKNTIPAFGIGTSQLFNFQNEDDYTYIRDGFDLEIEVPYKTIVFNLDSKFPNVQSHTARIVYLISKKQIRFFYFITNFETKNWDERKMNNDIEWFFSQNSIHSEKEIFSAVKIIFETLTKRVQKELNDKFETQEEN